MTNELRHYCEGGWINANYCPNCGARMDGGGRMIYAVLAIIAAVIGAVLVRRAGKDGK